MAGGLAGGLKYVKDGIFFKFAVDNLGIYSGDHNAMKAAGHELKGLAAFMNCQVFYIIYYFIIFSYMYK